MESKKTQIAGKKKGQAKRTPAGFSNRALEYSRFLDTQKVTDEDELKATLNTLLEEIGLPITPGLEKTSRGLSSVASGSVRGSKQAPLPTTSYKPPLSVQARHLQLYRWHAERILLDLLEASKMDRLGWLRYQRNRNAYTTGQLLHARNFSCDAVVKIVDAMMPKRLGWVDHAKGFYVRDEKDNETEEGDERNQRGRCSRMKATDKLLAKFGEVQHTWIKQKPIPNLTRIVVKDKDREIIPPPDDDLAIRLRRETMEAQTLSDNATIELRLPPEGWEELRQVMREGDVLLDLTGRSLYRVFNDGSMEKGGRYYGRATRGCHRSSDAGITSTVNPP